MLLALLLACGAQHEVSSVGPMTTTWIELDQGDLQLEGDLGRAGTLTWDTQGSSSTKTWMDRETLHITGRCFWLSCRTNLRFDVPRNVPITALVGTGEVKLNNLDRDVQLQIAHGNVVGTNLGASQVRIQVNGGNVNLEFSKIPKRIDVDTVVGNIEVLVPYALYAVDDGPNNLSVVPDWIPVHLRTTSGSAKLIKRPPPTP